MISRFATAVLFALLGLVTLRAAPEAVTRAEPDKTSPWVGERVTVAVELTVAGHFSGDTAFDLPELQGALIMKPDPHALLSAKTVDGVEYAVQRHELVLFLRRSGPLVVPDIAVRYGSVDGIGKPVVAHEGRVPGFRIEAKSPKGTKPGETVLATSGLTVDTAWKPLPGAGKTGDAFTRTVTVRADGLPAMILPAPSTPSMSGVAAYPKRPLLKDLGERGEFTGERTDVTDFVFQKPGDYRFPEIRLRHWDPGTATWKTETVPAVEFKIAAGPAYLLAQKEREAPHRRRIILASLALGVAVSGVCALVVAGVRRRRNAPEAVRFRALIAACGKNDPGAAYVAWLRWSEDIPEDDDAWKALQETLVAGTPGWRGAALARSAKRRRHARVFTVLSPSSALPALNP